MGINKKMSVFMSYATPDWERAKKLYLQLQQDFPNIDFWIDREKLSPGMDWDLGIKKTIQACDAAILVLTKKSVDKEGYIQKEFKAVLERAEEMPAEHIFVFSVRLEECDVPYRLTKWQYCDLFGRNNDYNKLKQAIRDRYQQVSSKTILPPRSKPNVALALFDTNIDILSYFPKYWKPKVLKITGYIKPVIEIHTKSKAKTYIASQGNLRASDFKTLLKEISPSCVIFSGTAYSLGKTQKSEVLISTEVLGYKIDVSKTNKQIFNVYPKSTPFKVLDSLVRDFSKQGKNKFKKHTGSIWLGSDLPKNYDIRNRFLELNSQSIGVSKLNTEFIELLIKKKIPWIIVKTPKGLADGKPIDLIFTEAALENSLKFLRNSNLNFSKHQNR